MGNCFHNIRNLDLFTVADGNGVATPRLNGRILAETGEELQSDGEARSCSGHGKGRGGAPRWAQCHGEEEEEEEEEERRLVISAGEG